jgi:hypothetical protein
MEYYLSELEELYKRNIPDIFERLLQFSLAKINLIKKDLVMYEFVARSFLDTSDELVKEMKTRYEKIYQEQMPRIFMDIDTKKIKKGVDVNKLIETILFCLEGLNAKHIKMFNENKLSFPDMNYKILEESMSYLDIIKYGAYES